MTTLFLTKVISLLVFPLGAAILIGCVVFALSFTSWRRIQQVLLGFMLVVLWISATPIFANWLNLRLESQFPMVGVDMLPHGDVAVLLGDASCSRILRAARIYRAGKVPLIVISGGDPPWQETVVPEAQRIANFLVALGVSPSALILETQSRNTRDNAVNTAVLFRQHGWRNGLLVTSGTHMRRALAAFQKVGLSMTPAVTDPDAIEFASVLDLLPDAAALAWTTSTIKEMIGLTVYRYLGWA